MQKDQNMDIITLTTKQLIDRIELGFTTHKYLLEPEAVEELIKRTKELLNDRRNTTNN